MALDGLISVVNDLIKLDRPSAGQLGALCVAACHELTMLNGDKQFFDMVQAPGPGGAASNPAVKEVFDDLKRFDTFLQHEGRVLLDAGLSWAAVDALLGRSREACEVVMAGPVSVDTIRTGLSGLQTSVCDAAGRLQKRAGQDAVTVEDRRLAERMFWVFGGVLIVFVNGAATGWLPGFVEGSIGTGVAIAAGAFYKG